MTSQQLKGKLDDAVALLEMYEQFSGRPVRGKPQLRRRGPQASGRRFHEPASPAATRRRPRMMTSFATPKGRTAQPIPPKSFRIGNRIPNEFYPDSA